MHVYVSVVHVCTVCVCASQGVQLGDEVSVLECMHKCV